MILKYSEAETLLYAVFGGIQLSLSGQLLHVSPHSQAPSLGMRKP